MKLGFESPTMPKTQKSPSLQEISWAAGVFEGDGSCCRTNSSEMVTVNQVDSWLPYKFQELFGGTVFQRENSGSARHFDARAIYFWRIYGSRARGFLMTVYSFLSPRRRQQIKRALKTRNGGK